MCLLIVKPKGRHINRDWITHGAKANPHGNGAAWIEKDGMWTIRSVCSADSFAKTAMDRIKDRPAIIHFRLATHGKKDDANCHPFPLLHGWWMAHNGIIAGLEHPEKSDTAMYAEILKCRMELDPDYLEKEESLEQMEIEIGWSKLAFLNQEGRHIIVNEKDGTWENGVWFSNDGHKEPKPFHHWEGYNYGREYTGTDWVTKWDRERISKTWPKEIGARDGARETVRGTSHIFDFPEYCDDCGVEFGQATGTQAHLSDDGDDLLCRDCYNWRENYGVKSNK